MAASYRGSGLMMLRTVSANTNGRTLQNFIGIGVGNKVLFNRFPGVLASSQVPVIGRGFKISKGTYGLPAQLGNSDSKTNCLPAEFCFGIDVIVMRPAPGEAPRPNGRRARSITLSINRLPANQTGLENV